MPTETERIIKDCFEKAGMRGVKDETAKMLFRLLVDAISKRDKRVQEEYISDLIINEGYSLELGEARITSCDNAREYTGNKDFVVSQTYKKDRGFDTIKGAIKYVENHYHD